MKEGDQPFFFLTGNGILFKQIPKLENMVAIDAGYAKPEEVNRKIIKLREEY
jgi:hypothetical protein